MNRKQKLEATSGVVTAVLGIVVMIAAGYVEKLTAEKLDEPASIGQALVISFALYGLPALLVAVGAYAHSMKKRWWGRALLLTATLFLIVWFFLSFSVLIWSKWLLLSWAIVLVTGFAILTSVISVFVVRGERNGSSYV